MGATRLKGLLLGAAVGLSCGGAAYANPDGAQVVHGVVNMSRPNSHTLNITNNPNAIINWQKFSIGQNEITRFIQQSGNSAVLNRVISQNPSAILGQLLSNGRVFLINPNGIAFGKNAVVDTNGLIASTLNISNQNFLAGKYEFEAGVNGAGAITNQGFIQADPGGSVYLIAPSVENSGIIQADDGRVILAAGHHVTIASLDTGGLLFDVQAPEDEVLNLGELIAKRGTVGTFAGTLKNSGVIEAGSVGVDGAGNIVLGAKADIYIESGSRIAASGADGGEISIRSESGTTWVAGAIEARGVDGTGGQVEVLGDRVGLIDNASIDVAGKWGGGEILIGGDYQGQGDTQTASRTFVGPDTTLTADALTAGDGGTVVVWSEEGSQIHGAISARGGSESGDGGLVETSGKFALDVSTVPDIGADAGQAGEWLIDPNDIEIVAGLTVFNITAANPFDTLDDNAQLGIQNITDALTGGANVTVTTGTAGDDLEDGDITLNAALDINTTIGTNTLTLSAAENIFINAPITDSALGGQTLNLVLQSDTFDDSIAGTVISADIDLEGGTLTTNSDFVSVDNGATVTIDGSTWNSLADRLEIGADSAGTVDVINGGTLNHSGFNGMQIGVGPGGVGVLNVNTSGSVFSTGDGGIAVGTGGGGLGTVDIQSGGLIDVTSDFFNHFVIGADAGSTGNVTIFGSLPSASTLRTRGTDNVVFVGLGGTGTLNMSGGAELRTAQFDVARLSGSDGTAVIDGPLTQVIVSPDDGQFSAPFSGAAGFARVAREDGAVGSLTVQNEALLQIREGAGGSESGPEFQISRNRGASGTVTVTNSGVIELVQITAPVFDPELFPGPTFELRRGDAQLTISNDGEVRLLGDEAFFQVATDRDFRCCESEPGTGPGANTEQSRVDILSGGSLLIAGLNARMTIGDGSTDNHNPSSDGLVIVNGNNPQPSQIVILGGANVGEGGGLSVGETGTGELRIEAGALVVVESGNFNNVDVARQARSTGTLIVDGSGFNPSSLITSGEDHTIQIGRRGTGTATFSGGALAETIQFEVGRAGIGIATITGVGTLVDVSPDNGLFASPFEDSAGFVRAGRRAGSDGRIDVLDGAHLLIRTTVGGTDGEPFMSAGREVGSFGQITVDDTGGNGSLIEIRHTTSAGSGPGFQIGRRGEGHLIARNGGQIVITGDGGFAEVGQGGDQSGFTGGAADPNPGSPNAQSTFTIESGGGFTMTSDFSAFIIGRQQDGDGLVTVTDSGSSFVLDGDFSSLTVGQDNTARGELVVTNNATLTTMGDDTQIFIGQNFGSFGRVSVSGGSVIDTLSFNVGNFGVGVATITGAGSEVIASNDNGHFTGLFVNKAGIARAGAGDDGDGTIEVLSGGRLTVRDSGAEFGPELGVAMQASSFGTVIVDGAGSVIDLQQSTAGNTDPNIFDGPILYTDAGEGEVIVRNGGTVQLNGESSQVVMAIGFQPSGSGTLDVLSGGQVSITGDNANLSMGAFDPSAEGAVTVDGATSSLTLSGTNAFIEIGGSGSGVLTVDNGGTVTNDPAGISVIGRFGGGGSSGLAQISGAASTFDAGAELFIGQDEFFTIGGGGALNLQGGSNVSAGTIENADVISGTGTITANVNMSDDDSVFPLITPGESIGLIAIIGDLTLTDNGRLFFEIADVGVGGTDFDQVTVTGTANLTGGLQVVEIEGFEMSVGDSFDVLTYGINGGGTFGVGTSFGDIYAAVERVNSATIEPTATDEFFVWDGSAGDDDWNTGSNWTGPGGDTLNTLVPGTDVIDPDVLIDTDTGAPVTLASGFQEVGRLEVKDARLGDDLLITGGTLDVEFVSRFTGDVMVDGGGLDTRDLLVIDGGATVTVDSGSWTDTFGPILGEVGTGSVVVGINGTFDSQNIIIGDQVGSSGTVAVSNGDWNNTDQVIVGDEGTGIINVNVGGTFSSQSLSLGQEAGSIGTLNIDGNSSTVTVTNDLRVGEGGDGALNLTDGASLSSLFIDIGLDPGSQGAVTVEDSTLTTTNSIVVGFEGTGELLVDTNVSGSSVADVGSFFEIAREMDTSGNTVAGCAGAAVNFSCVTVRDPGAVINVNGSSGSGFNVGTRGFAELRIENGGLVNSLSGAFDVVANATGSHGIITVDGAGSELNSRFGFDVGHGSLEANFGIPDAATIGELNILNGGVVNVGTAYVPGTFGGGVSLGRHRNSEGTLLIDGTNSILHTFGEDNFLTVGLQGKGVATVQNEGSIKTYDLEVGRGPGAGIGDPSTLTITGAGTEVFVTSEDGVFSGGFEFEGGFMRVARNFGDIGVLNVLDGALLELNGLNSAWTGAGRTH